MADQAYRQDRVRFRRSGRLLAIGGAVLLVVVAVGTWFWVTRGRETTDDAQVEARVTMIAAKVAGTVLTVAFEDNQSVEAGMVLVEIDPRDYQVAVAKARAELADAEGSAVAALSSTSITSTTASGNLTTAQASVDQAQGGVDAAQREVEAARSHLTTAQAHQREAEANATKASRDVERLRGLLAKDEVSQQQFDGATAAAEAQRAAADSTRSQVSEAEGGIHVAESRLIQARAGEQQARGSLSSAKTVPEQITEMKARASSAQARVEQAKASLAQAELNLQYSVIRAPATGVAARKSVNPGQVVQQGQPLLALVEVNDVWITANFKETQLTFMRPGQRATIDVDAYGDKTFKGHVDSIAPATGARFSLLPPENATGNYVKVVQRVPVKIVLDAGQDPEHLLRPGMSVVPRVYTR
jgi:membrane fusion protein (multidrug efflux system)